MDRVAPNADLTHALQEIYRRLYERYGPQHWWPGEEPFEVMVGAVLTQSAAWVNVERAIANLKAAGALNPRTLREIPLPDLARLIRPSGYFNAKARKLKALVEWLEKSCGDDLDRLFSRDMAGLRRELLGVYGIGEETADSILLYAASKPSFVIDAYTHRILHRLGLADDKASYAGLQELFTARLPRDVPLYNEYHALLVRHGKTTCKRRNPACSSCCLGDLCLSPD